MSQAATAAALCGSTKRKMKRLHARVGDPSRPGFKLRSICPECGEARTVTERQKAAKCRNQHNWRIR